MASPDAVFPKLTLISFHLCPYVQRAAIALAEKGVSFERVYIDPAEKPTWIQAISPLDEVPVLKVETPDGFTPIFESSAILEYREETQLTDGPWFAGTRFSLVDAVYGPVFRHFDIFDEIADFGILDGLDRVKEWRAALARRESIKTAFAPDYPNRLMNYLQCRNSALTRCLAA